MSKMFLFLSFIFNSIVGYVFCYYFLWTLFFIWNTKCLLSGGCQALSSVEAPFDVAFSGIILLMFTLILFPVVYFLNRLLFKKTNIRKKLYFSQNLFFFISLFLIHLFVIRGVTLQDLYTSFD